jgi:hypothetical protein
MQAIDRIVTLAVAGLAAAGSPATAQGPNPRAKLEQMIEIAPDKGMPPVGAIAIDWCSKADTSDASGGALKRMLQNMEERGWHWDHVPRAAAQLCGNPGDPQYQRQAGYFVQGLVNLTGQAPAQVVADLRLRMDPERWAREREVTCKRFEVSQEASVETRELANAHRELFGCGYDPVPAWWLDRASITIDHHLDRTLEQPTQLQRAYHVARCMAASSKPEAQVLTYALCSPDAAALDPATLDREMAAAGHNAYAKAIARQHVSHVRRRWAALEGRVRALAAKDAAYQQLAFTVPMAAWKRALERRRSHAEALERSAAYEAAFYGPSKSASKGCSTQLRDDFRGYVRGTKPANLDQLATSATDDIGLLLLARLAACEARDGSPQAAEMLYKLGHTARSARGPRLAVYHALVDALGEIRADRERFAIEPGDLPNMPMMEIWNDALSAASSGITATQATAGVVKATKPAGDGVIVEFATESWTEDDWHCKDSNKIWKIESGRVIYHQTCKKTGKRTVKRTAPTVWVPAAYADKLTRGAFVELDYDLKRSHDKSIGMPRTIYKDKSRAKLVAAYGVQL